MSEQEPTLPAHGGAGPSKGDDVAPAPAGEPGGTEPTVGTGSFFAIGCVILLVVGVIVLGAVFFRP